jgi:hypothetical protein
MFKKLFILSAVLMASTLVAHEGEHKDEKKDGTEVAAFANCANGKCPMEMIERHRQEKGYYQQQQQPQYDNYNQQQYMQSQYSYGYYNHSA